MKTGKNIDAQPGNASFIPGEILVQMKPGVSLEQAQAILGRFEAVRLRYLFHSTIELWRVPIHRERATLALLLQEPAIANASLNYKRAIIDLKGIPNDPDYSKQWGLEKIQATGAWEITTGSANVKIAILDTGVDESHPDLANRLIPGYDFVNHDANPHDDHGHGTHVTGIAGAASNNATGVTGVDWNARILPVKVIAANGYGSDATIIDGINWAVAQGAKVINMSFGGGDYSSIFQNAVTNAWANGVVLIAAAGNTGNNVPQYPAAFEHVIAVSATTKGDNLASFSSYGTHLDLAAPGVDIYSTIPNNQYEYNSGTSMAAPFVAGLVGLIRGRAPYLTPAEVEQALINSAVDLGTPGFDDKFGYGRINAQAALAQFALPAAPLLLPIQNSQYANTYLVDWEPSENATSYTLAVDDQLDFTSPEEIYTGIDTQFQVVNQVGGTWYYHVRANGDFGSSVWSNSVSTGVVPGTPDLAPIVNPSHLDQYTITWSGVFGAEGYLLEEDDQVDFSSPVTRYSGQESSYLITGQPGGIWYYRVRAYNLYGNGPWSMIASTNVNATTLITPILFPIENPEKDGSFIVQWSLVNTASHYILEESDSPYFESPALVYNGVENYYEFIEHPTGTWYFRVRAATLAEQSPWSNSVSTVVTDWLFLPLVTAK